MKRITRAFKRFGTDLTLPLLRGIVPSFGLGHTATMSVSLASVKREVCSSCGTPSSSTRISSGFRLRIQALFCVAHHGVQPHFLAGTADYREARRLGRQRQAGQAGAEHGQATNKDRARMENLYLGEHEKKRRARGPALGRSGTYDPA
jgi:hypothetical protein